MNGLITSDFGVVSITTLYILKRGEIKNMISGHMPKKTLESFIDKNL